MKKIIFGMTMFLAGTLSVAMLLAGSMANDWTLNGKHSAIWNISRYGLMPVVYVFIGVALIGLIFAVWELFDYKNQDSIKDRMRQVKQGKGENNMYIFTVSPILVILLAGFSFYA